MLKLLWRRIKQMITVIGSTVYIVIFIVCMFLAIGAACIVVKLVDYGVTSLP